MTKYLLAAATLVAAYFVLSSLNAFDFNAMSLKQAQEYCKTNQHDSCHGIPQE